jgi:hypothetical protein
MRADDDQQPIRLTVGRRRARVGQAPDEASRAALARMANYRTRAPKGVYFYETHDAMAADRLRWSVDAVVDKARARLLKR